MTGNYGQDPTTSAIFSTSKPPGLSDGVERCGAHVCKVDYIGVTLTLMPTTPTILDREIYSEAEAARLLKVSQSVLSYWLNGGERRGKTYPPIIRPEPRDGRPPVTWAEFVEASLLHAYRREHLVPMKELRTFINILRKQFGVPYPLADRRPYVSGKQLVLDAQNEAGLDNELCLVWLVGGQTMLSPASEAFYQRVRWDGNIAAGWRPSEERDSPVIVDPDQRFGRPSIRGISTEAIWEHQDAGESNDEIAEAFGLQLSDVAWALAYELPNRAA
jgi:uncharacterized protein (DUF433 family)/transposase